MSEDAAGSRPLRPDYLPCAIEKYEADPQKYSDMWRRAKTESAWGALLDLFPAPPVSLADIAAGDGRDALYFEEKGYDVTAVEPSGALRALACKKNGARSSVRWVDSAFPALDELKPASFGMITVNAGFVHVKKEDHAASLRSLFEIAAEGGRVAVSLRGGALDEQRCMFPSDAAAFGKWAEDAGFKVLRFLTRQPDALGREDVFWDYIMLEKE
ncbi:MAG: methyltransferase domain-containing protein [Alphaproteobacteria bacterium]|nr:methyltransferase domain-containing protein [Alphaproteobacteria bacterium]